MVAAPRNAGEETRVTNDTGVGHRAVRNKSLRVVVPVEHDEPGLVSLVQQGDVEAFGELVKRYADRAYGVALSIVGAPQDAEDAVQDAMVAALTNS